MRKNKVEMAHPLLTEAMLLQILNEQKLKA
jgi:hypothetical protein